MGKHSESPPDVLSPYTTNQTISFIESLAVNKIYSGSHSRESCHPTDGVWFAATPRPQYQSYLLYMRFTENHMEPDLTHAKEPPAPEFINLNNGILFFKADIENLLEYILGTSIEFHPEFAETEHQDLVEDGHDYRYPYYWGAIDAAPSNTTTSVRKRRSRLQRYRKRNNDALGESLDTGRTSIPY